MSRLLLLGEVGAQPEWAGELSREDGRTIMPVLLQRCYTHELVWFSDGQPVSQREFHVLRSKFGDLQFTTHADKRAIHASKDGKVVALIWSCGVPDPGAEPAMRHEMVLRGPLPTDAERLKAVVVEHLAPVLHAGANELNWASNRLLDWLEGRDERSYAWAADGIIEWRKCGAVELMDDIVFVFKGTSVHLSSLFHAVGKGQTVAAFLTENPSVTKDQVDTVLEHLTLSLCI